MPKILPVLHGPTAFDTHKYASRFLADSEAVVPVVSYLRTDDDGNSNYVSWKIVEKRKGGLQELDSKALKALVERPDRPGWNPVNVLHRGEEVTIMQRVGDFYTASDVMDPELMEILHNFFKNDTVFVGIPHACYMVASTSPEYVFNDFYTAYDEAVTENVQFAEQVLRIDNGQITEVLETMPVAPAPQMKTVKEQGILWFNMPYRGNFEHLSFIIRNDAKKFIPSYRTDPHFSGRVIFEISDDTPPFTPAQVQQVGQLEVMLNVMAEENEWTSFIGEQVLIRVRFSQRTKTVSGLDMNALQKLKDSARQYDDRQKKQRAKKRKTMPKVNTRANVDMSADARSKTNPEMVALNDLKERKRKKKRTKTKSGMKFGRKTKTFGKES